MADIPERETHSHTLYRRRRSRHPRRHSPCTSTPDAFRAHDADCHCSSRSTPRHPDGPEYSSHGPIPSPAVVPAPASQDHHFDGSLTWNPTLSSLTAARRPQAGRPTRPATTRATWTLSSSYQRATVGHFGSEHHRTEQGHVHRR